MSRRLSSRLVAPRPLYGALSAKLLPPLPPESLECDPQALPPPHYVPRGVSARRAHFVEVSERLPSPSRRRSRAPALH